MYDEQKRTKATAFRGHECLCLAIGFKAVEAVLSHHPAGFAKDEEDEYDR